jgi:hypothetical protein
LASYLSCAFRDDAICDTAGEPQPKADRYAFLGMVSHMHKRSQKFVADLMTSDGTRIARSDDMIDADDGSAHLYVNRDYDDPINRAFWPPIIVEKGQKLEYTCSRERRPRAGAPGCETLGVPPGKSILEAFGGQRDIYGGALVPHRRRLRWRGYRPLRAREPRLRQLADDDMCILPGLFYDCSAEGPA